MNGDHLMYYVDHDDVRYDVDHDDVRYELRQGAFQDQIPHVHA